MRWVVKFVQRHDLPSGVLHGETGNVSTDKAVNGVLKLREKLNKFGIKTTLNMEESGLLPKLLPRRTYICKSKNSKSVSGTKAISEKE